MCEFSVFTGSGPGAACVQHVHLHRAPFISRAEIISMSSFFSTFEIYRLFDFLFLNLISILIVLRGLAIINTFPNGNTV